MMSALDVLRQIEEEWVRRVSARIARGVGVRESFVEQAARFYQGMLGALESGDPAWIEPVIDSWVDAQTVTDLEDAQPSPSHILSELLLETQEVCEDALSPKEVVVLTSAILPVFSHAYEYAAARDIRLKMDRLVNDLEEAQSRVELLDRSKSDFISVAAHELKTPLTLIEGYTSMIRELLPEDQRDYFMSLVQGIDKGTRRLREIIDDMIDVSMLDNNLLSLNYQPVWIDRILNTLRDDLSHSLRERNLAFSSESFPGFDQMTFGDPERLYQAFRNILINAIKFTPDGGAIRVGGRKLPGFLEITITDTGIGIDPADHQLIFEKFGRLGNISLHSSGKTKFKGGGPGLGLPIAKGLIEAHGGTIWVESEKQDEVACPGSTFHVMLPLLTEPPDDRSARLFKSIIEGIDSK